MRIDADREEMRVSWEREQRQKAYMKHCPFCCVCDERITDAKCYVLNRDYPMESCIHENCFKDELKKLEKAKLTVVFAEEIGEVFTYSSDYWQTTPHGEEF